MASYHVYGTDIRTSRKDSLRRMVLSTDFIFSLCSQPTHIVHKIQGIRIYPATKRIKLFQKLGTKCVKCSRKGTFFALEKHSNSKINKDYPYHLNLYGIEYGFAPGDEVEFLITLDHIIPVARGGSNSERNLQPMCRECNLKKGTRFWSHIDYEIAHNRKVPLIKTQGAAS